MLIVLIFIVTKRMLQTSSYLRLAKEVCLNLLNFKLHTKFNSNDGSTSSLFIIAFSKTKPLLSCSISMNTNI